MTTLDELKAGAAERRLDGVYKQCGDNDYIMLRVRAPACRLSADQFMTITELSGEYGDGVLHLTTRGDVELHGISLGKLDEVIERLGRAGLSTRGACGDCVRNVTACPGSCLCPNESVNVGRVAREISRELAKSGQFEGLPRKFKVSVSGCSRACALPQLQDVGLVARAKQDVAYEQEAQFDVFLAGGLGRRPMLARKVSHVVRLRGVIPFVRAAAECFNDLGDRQRRHRARLKFVAEKLGHEALLTQILKRLAEQTWYPQI